MKVMVFGSEVMIQRLTASLVGEGIDVVGTSDRLEMMALLNRERFDIAMVSSLAGETEASCRCIRGLWGIPVVSVVEEEETDWERLQRLDPDGYIKDELGGTEVAARLRAVVRRWKG